MTVAIADSLPAASLVDDGVSRATRTGGKVDGDLPKSTALGVLQDVALLTVSVYLLPVAIVIVGLPIVLVARLALELVSRL
jgi:hypothetical protein